nr:hypothetical protein [Klebsiella pneumoniae]
MSKSTMPNRRKSDKAIQVILHDASMIQLLCLPGPSLLAFKQRRW